LTDSPAAQAGAVTKEPVGGNPAGRRGWRRS